LTVELCAYTILQCILESIFLCKIIGMTPRHLDCIGGLACKYKYSSV
jgi:hypothetical protein